MENITTLHKQYKNFLFAHYLIFKTILAVKMDISVKKLPLSETYYKPNVS